MGSQAVTYSRLTQLVSNVGDNPILWCKFTILSNIHSLVATFDRGLWGVFFSFENKMLALLGNSDLIPAVPVPKKDK